MQRFNYIPALAPFCSN